MTTAPEARAQHLNWLLELTAIPTAAGKERRVVRWIERWAAQRPGVELSRDPSGNLVLSMAGAPRTDTPLFFTAHLDHPAFVVDRVLSPSALELEFRGGVMSDYFPGAPVRCLDRDDRPFRGTIAREVKPSAGEGARAAHFKRYLVELAEPASSLASGDVAVWDLPPSEVIDGLAHTPACDDLAAAAAALAAFDLLLSAKPAGDVRLLFTRAEEIGFVGAIAAVRHGTMPRGSRVLALENSRSFDDSPINGGPIVRVGDRLSVFSPSLTGAVAARAEEIAGGPASPTAQQKLASLPAWKWQRKLMPGGACEATVFCNAGYEATCLCLPLGNYHNMADLAAVQAGTFSGTPRIEREYIGVSDYHGLVDLLEACGRRLGQGTPIGPRLEKLWNDLGFVLDDPAEGPAATRGSGTT